MIFFLPIGHIRLTSVLCYSVTAYFWVVWFLFDQWRRREGRRGGRGGTGGTHWGKSLNDHVELKPKYFADKDPLSNVIHIRNRIIFSFMIFVIDTYFETLFFCNTYCSLFSTAIFLPVQVKQWGYLTFVSEMRDEMKLLDFRSIENYCDWGWRVSSGRWGCLYDWVWSSVSQSAQNGSRPQSHYENRLNPAGNVQKISVILTLWFRMKWVQWYFQAPCASSGSHGPAAGQHASHHSRYKESVFCGKVNKEESWLIINSFSMLNGHHMTASY